MSGEGCPCTLGQACSDACTCANEFMSGGCMMCCCYGSAEQRMAQANAIMEAVNGYARLTAENAALRAVAKAAVLVLRWWDEDCISSTWPGDHSELEALRAALSQLQEQRK